MDLKRGDVVVCVVSGDYGKPRPAVVVQSDLFNPTHPSVTVCPLTSHIVDAGLFRINIEPSAASGVRVRSQIMVDKIMSIPREKIAERIGHLAATAIHELHESLHLWLDLRS